MIKRVGFYREIGGQATTAHDAPSLRDAVQDSGPWEEDRVLAYLESALEIYSTTGAERDVLTGDEWITGAGSLVTDGTWLWPADLVHYVRRHHAALPQEFLDHIRTNGYTVPAVPDDLARHILQPHPVAVGRRRATPQRVVGQPARGCHVARPSVVQPARPAADSG